MAHVWHCFTNTNTRNYKSYSHIACLHCEIQGCRILFPLQRSEIVLPKTLYSLILLKQNCYTKETEVIGKNPP